MGAATEQIMSDVYAVTEDEDFFHCTHRLMARLRAESPVRRVSVDSGDDEVACHQVRGCEDRVGGA
jgi:hypothetical protein